MLSFIKKNYISILLVAILLTAAFLRIYRIEDYMTFLGDEGRDVLIVREILHGNLTLLGPRASAADFFTGPIYYYMMVPFLLLFNYHPVGPAIMVALLGVATVYLIYRFGSEWFGTKAALIAAAIYAVAPIVIRYSRSSWNPNPMPFFTLLILYFLYKFVNKQSSKGLFFVGILYGIAFQLHYIETVVGVIIVSFVLIGNIILHKKQLIGRLVRQYFAIAAGFILGFSPFLVFEARHGFQNTQAIIKFMLYGDKSGVVLDTPFVQLVSDVFIRVFGRLVLYSSSQDLMMLNNKNVDMLWAIMAAILGIAAVAAIFTVKDKLVKLLLILWIFFGVILFGFYHKPIYDYYFAFMFPLPFLLVGNLFSYLSKRNMVAKVVVAVLVFAILAFNLSGIPFRYEPNRQYNQVKTIAEFVLEKANGKPYNFALLTPGNSDHAYRYFFEVNGKNPVTILNPQIDPERKSVTDQLLVVCEDPNCEPLGASLWEVAGFGRAEVAGKWPVIVVNVYKLVHYKEK